jgi:hypothetical protein
MVGEQKMIEYRNCLLFANILKGRKKGFNKRAIFLPWLHLKWNRSVLSLAAKNLETKKDEKVGLGDQ